MVTSEVCSSVTISELEACTTLCRELTFKVNNDLKRAYQ
jgi:hypothetical protein